MEETTTVKVPYSPAGKSGVKSKLAGAGIGLLGGTGLSVAESTKLYLNTLDKTADVMRDIGFLEVQIKNGNNLYFTTFNDELATWTGEYWDLENKLDIGGLLLSHNLPALGAAASTLAIPFYAKNHPGIALAHLLVASGEVIGNSIKNTLLAKTTVDAYGGNSWSLQNFATEKLGVAGTNPALFYLDEIALGILCAGTIATAAKAIKDYKATKPSKAIKELPANRY
ncbi:MAG: hypothetical protein WC307_04040 [Candidatus Nanoarchaeia archaeon]|jgi:hypothetical protein